MTEPGWELYRTFLFVLKHGSLSAAGRELGLAQPTVGRHIEALETMLERQLFTRSPQGLLPTEMALALKPFAEMLAATSAALLRAAADARDRVSGTVRISASEVIGVEVLPTLLKPLLDTWPELVIELSTTDEIEDILHRQADIAVRMGPTSQGALLARKIGGIQIGLFARRDYLERHGVPQSFAELSDHRMIGYDRENAYIRSMSGRFSMLGNARPTFRADSNLAQLAAIRAGIGIGICQVAVVRDNPDLVRVLPDLFSIELETHVAMHEDLKSAPRCRVTFDALVEGLIAYRKSTLGTKA